MNFIDCDSKDMTVLPKCQSGDTSGFPIKLSQSIFTDWPATKNTEAQIKSLTVPSDFTIQWGPPASSAQISVVNNRNTFQIRGFTSITDATTLTYGTATYACSEVLSIVQNQHPFFTNDNEAIYEIILAFQIKNKSTNPSSPDVILVTRPIVFSNYTPIEQPFWSAVNKAVSKKTIQSTSFDMSRLYGYNSSTLMPMITYQTCLPVKLLNYDGQSSVTGSITMRVNVVIQPLYVIADDNGLGKCSSVKKYILVTEPKQPVDIFPNSSANTTLQFRDGYGKDLFPTHSENYHIPIVSGDTISDFKDILHKLEILVPEDFLGKSLGEIADIENLPEAPTKKKAFKCYRINPEKDIKDDQILIDPTTGETLQKTMNQEALESAGGDLTLAGLNAPDISSGLMPGDIQEIILTVFIWIGTILLLAYLGFIVHTLIVRKELQKGIYNTVILLVLIIALSLFGSFLKK